MSRTSPPDAVPSAATPRPRIDRFRVRVRWLVTRKAFQWTVIALILVNAAILGVETLPGVKERWGHLLIPLDRAIVWAFFVEIVLRIIAAGRFYLRNGWNVFDVVIVATSMIAATSGLAAIRAFRVLRVLRVVTVIPRMRLVVRALLDSIPGIASVGVVVVLILYVFAVIAANLYGPQHPELFGDVFVSMYTLFEVMTLEGWAEIAGEVAETHPNSWAFFVSFVLIATFTMLNLFVAIVVRVVEEEGEELDAAIHDEHKDLRKEIRGLRRQLADLSAKLERREGE